VMLIRHADRRQVEDARSDERTREPQRPAN
jgi:hypothetical protein